MTSQSEQGTRYTLITHVPDWVIRSLESNDGFSVLLVTEKPTGKKMTKYQLDTVEDALVRCRADLSHELGDATEYALVYDARIQLENDVKPLLIFQVERRGKGYSVQLRQLYKMKRKFFSSKSKFIPLSGFESRGNTEQWLANA